MVWYMPDSKWFSQVMQYRNKVFRVVYLIFLGVSLVILISGLVSCNSSGEKQKREENSVLRLLKDAERAVDSNPSKSIVLSDSAINIAKSSSIADSVLLKLFSIRARLYANAENADSALPYYQKARDMAVRLGDSLKLARIYRDLGDLQTQYGSIGHAEKNYMLSIGIYEKMGRKYDAALTKICYTQLLSFRGDFELSQKKLMEVYLLLDKLDSLEAEISVFNGIGNNFKEIGNHRQAVVYFLKAYQTAMKFSDNYNAMVTLNNVGTCYMHLQSDSALLYFQQALGFSAQVGATGLDVMVRYNIANFLIKKGKYQQATKILEQVLHICIKAKITDGVARTYSALAEIAEKTGQLSKAAELCQKAIVLADSTGRRALKLTLMQQDYEIVKKGGDCNAALILSEEIKMLADSIMNTEKQLEIYKLERQYQADKTELENANLKLQLASQNERLEYRQNFMIVMVIALLILSFLLFLLYRTFSERTIAYKVLIGQYEEERVNKNSLGANGAMAVRPEINMVAKHEKLNESEQLLGQLQNYFELNKPFLDPKLRVDTVADNLNVTPKAIAAALKGYHDNNFNLFTNRYRVEAAKTLLEDPVGRQYKINVIATNSGFGSKQSFYTAFEQFTGIKPSYYRDHFMGKQEPKIKDTAED